MDPSTGVPKARVLTFVQTGLTTQRPRSSIQAVLFRFMWCIAYGVQGFWASYPHSAQGKWPKPIFALMPWNKKETD